MIDKRKYLEDFVKTNTDKDFISISAERTDTLYLRRIFSEDVEDAESLMEDEWNDDATLSNDAISPYDDGTTDGELTENVDEILPEDDNDDDELSQDDVKKNVLLSEIIANDGKAVIFGRPGTGKTTVLVNEAVSMARHILNGQESSFPVYIALKDVKEDNTLKSIVSPFTDGTVIDGRTVFFFDGMNEVNPSCREDVTETISDIIDNNKDCGIIIASRLYGYDHDFGFPEYELCSFDNTSIHEYILKRTGNDDAYDILIKRPAVIELCRTPLVLRMVVDLYEKFHEIPEFRSGLYENFIDYQIGKIPEIREEDKKPLIKSMSRLAYGMRTNGYLSDSMDGFQKMVSDFADGLDVRRLSDMMLRSGLLLVDDSTSGVPYISFIHETFQEYLSATYIAMRYLTDGEFPVDVTTIEWRETMRLVVEILYSKVGGAEMIGVAGNVQKNSLRCPTTRPLIAICRHSCRCSLP